MTKMKAANWLECPVCEYRFSVPPEYLNKTGKCPKCDHVFDAANCQIPEKKISADRSEPPIPVPAVIGELATDSAGTSGAPVPPPVDMPVAESLPEIQSSRKPDGQVEHPYVAADKRVTDPNRVLIWVSLSCVLAIALLIGIPAVASWMMNPGEDDGDQRLAENFDEGATESPAEGAEPSPKNKNKKRDADNKSSGKDPKSAQAVEDFTDEERQAIWSKCHTGIALVNAIYGTENKASHGVVLSDDGKIAVNLSSIQGADEIRVKFALAEYGAENRWSTPVKATRLINSRPDVDVAIIQVPAKTQPVESRSVPVASNERGVVPILSNRKSSEFLRLTKFQPAKPFAALQTREQNTLRELSLQPEDNDYFVLHTAKLNPTGLGSPVFDEEGRLVGMHLTHHEKTRTSFLIPPATLKKILHDPLAKPVPITRQVNAAGSGSSRSDAAEANTPSGSPLDARGGSDSPPSLDEALAGMKQLDWKLATPEAYRAATDFAWRWWEVHQEYPQAEFTRRLKIEEWKKEVAGEMEQKLFWPSKDEARWVNEAAIQAFRDQKKGWVALVQILKPAGLADYFNGEPAILVQLAETDEKALLIPGEVEGPFLQGSEWIVFGFNEKNTRLNTADGKCLVIRLAGGQKK